MEEEETLEVSVKCTEREKPTTGDNRKATIYKQKRKAQGETKFAGTMILDFQPPEP